MNGSSPSLISVAIAKLAAAFSIEIHEKNLDLLD
jgi:hypothetical protein